MLRRKFLKTNTFGHQLICEQSSEVNLCSPLTQIITELKKREQNPMNHNVLLNCSLRSIFDIIHGEFDLCHLIDKRVLKEGNTA